MTQFLQFLIIGISKGAIYGLIALGFVLVFKATRVFNYAQGHLMMVGSFMLIAFGPILGLNVWLAMLIAFLSAIFIGLSFERVFVRPLLGLGFLAIVMATIGAALIISAVIQISFGTYDRPFTTPIAQGVYVPWGVHIAKFDLLTIGVAVAAFVIFGLFFRFTSMGLQMRAAAESNEAAALSGISISRVSAVAWSVSTMLAFICGIILANKTQIVNISLADLGLYAFPAVVIGGLESVPGAIIGGMVVGLLESFSGGYISTDSSQAIVYAGLLVMLLIKPSGLFGQQEIARV
jgi:branched-chain amino acid transport system permease protein